MSGVSWNVNGGMLLLMSWKSMSVLSGISTLVWLVWCIMIWNNLVNDVYYLEWNVMLSWIYLEPGMCWILFGMCLNSPGRAYDWLTWVTSHCFSDQSDDKNNFSVHDARCQGSCFGLTYWQFSEKELEQELDNNLPFRQEKIMKKRTVANIEQNSVFKLLS